MRFRSGVQYVLALTVAVSLFLSGYMVWFDEGRMKLLREEQKVLALQIELQESRMNRIANHDVDFYWGGQ